MRLTVLRDKVHGFSVHVGHLPEGPEDQPVPAGLYPDFGYNGFDFWQFDPLWEGAVCATSIDEDGWAHYRFASPIKNDFKTYIVSGGGIEFLRVFAEDVYGIPPEQVVGSSIKTK